MPGNKQKRSGATWHGKAIALAAIVLAAILSDLLYDRLGQRSAVVEASAGSLRLDLTRELNGKFFENAIVCRRQEDDAPIQHDALYGCSGRTHMLTPPRNTDEQVGRENVNLTLPAGTNILLSARPGLVRLSVISVPDAYADSDAARLVGGAIVLDESAIPAFGTMTMTGRAVIGAGQSQTDLLAVTQGGYQFSGWTPTALLDGQWRMLRNGALLSGSTVYFPGRDSDAEGPFGQPVAQTRLTVSVPDPATSLLQVTAISAEGPMALKIFYFSTEPLTVRPSITDVLLADPILTFLATLILGLIAIYEFLRSRD
jgi:hypothetical protein